MALIDEIISFLVQQGYLAAVYKKTRGPVAFEVGGTPEAVAIGRKGYTTTHFFGFVTRTHRTKMIATLWFGVQSSERSPNHDWELDAFDDSWTQDELQDLLVALAAHFKCKISAQTVVRPHSHSVADAYG